MAVVKIDHMVVVVIVMIMAVGFHVSHGAVHRVGDSTGWTTLGNYDYKKWAASKTFHVGDTILFVYHPQVHNVMQVTHPEYQACNVSTPIVTYTTGNDSITITTRGHHFFLCGVPGHCQAGQKVDINVARVSAMAPTPSAAMPPSPSSTPNTTTVPAPSPNNAVPLCSSKTLWTMLGVAMTISAAFVSNIA